MRAGPHKPMPLPMPGAIVCDLSYTFTGIPTLVNANARVRPPMPPPLMTTGFIDDESVVGVDAMLRRMKLDDVIVADLSIVVDDARRRAADDPIITATMILSLSFSNLS